MIRSGGAMRACAKGIRSKANEEIAMKRWAWCLALSLMGSTASAETLDLIDDLGQAEFKAFSEDMAGAIGYKAISPAEPLGIIGFDIGIELTSTNMDSPETWGKAMSDSGKLSSLVLPKFYVQKGLPLNIDVGAYYIKVPGSNIEAWGGELKYAILEGSTVTPAVAIRGTYSGLFGVDQLDFETQSLDVSISKGFLFFTPYAGIGQQWTTSTPKGTAAALLNEESFSDNKIFVGLAMRPGIFNLSFEHETLGDVSSSSIKLGLTF